jgi:hypothetical protein
VYASIVGVDRLPTQFYDDVLTGLPVVPVPAGFLVQPIDPDEVAARLVELTLGRPAGRVPDLGGPQMTSWADLLRGDLRASHRHRWPVSIRIPGTRGRAGRRSPATTRARHRPPDVGAGTGRRGGRQVRPKLAAMPCSADS